MHDLKPCRNYENNSHKILENWNIIEFGKVLVLETNNYNNRDVYYNFRIKQMTGKHLPGVVKW